MLEEAGDCLIIASKIGLRDTLKKITNLIADIPDKGVALHSRELTSCTIHERLNGAWMKGLLGGCPSVDLSPNDMGTDRQFPHPHLRSDWALHLAY